MKRMVFITLCMMVVPSVSVAEKPWPLLPDGIRLLGNQDCVDLITKEEGDCDVFEDAQGNQYILFNQNHKTMFIRKYFLDESFINIWVSDVYGTI